MARRIPEQPEVNSWMLFYFHSRYRDAEMQKRLKDLTVFSAD